MKKSFLIISMIVLSGLALTACQKSNNYAVSVEMTDHAEERTAEDGQLLLSLTGNYPVVSVKGNEEAEKKINDYIGTLVTSIDQLADEDEAMAEEDAAGAETEEDDMGMPFNGYGLGSEYKTGRADSQVISFRQDVYEFTGGVHPNNAAAGYNFSTETGELLTLKDVVSDETAAKEFIADEILQQTKESIYSGMLFDDYEDEIADVFSDAVWYFSEDGFHVICNEYILGPHFTGILEFVIPYDQFTLLNDEYLLRAEK